jgi:hypothetical protein
MKCLLLLLFLLQVLSFLAHSVHKYITLGNCLGLCTTVLLEQVTNVLQNTTPQDQGFPLERLPTMANESCL